MLQQLFQFELFQTFTSVIDMETMPFIKLHSQKVFFLFRSGRAYGSISVHILPCTSYKKA